MEDRMFGVVLWADASESKAVIWCEDQGNLAYYTAGEQNVHQGVSLDAGDLIQFDVQENADFRRAQNPKRVGAGYAPDLAQDLRRQSHAPATHPARCSVAAVNDTPGDNIVPFPRRAR